MSVFKLDLADQEEVKGSLRNNFKVISVTVVDEVNLERCMMLAQNEEESKGSEMSRSVVAGEREFSDINSVLRHNIISSKNNNTNRSVVEGSVKGSNSKRIPEYLVNQNNEEFKIRQVEPMNRIKVFSSINNSVQTEERKLIMKNVSDRGLYLSSQRVINTQSFRKDTNSSKEVMKYTISSRKPTIDPKKLQKEIIGAYTNIRPPADNHPILKNSVRETPNNIVYRSQERKPMMLIRSGPHSPPQNKE